jgi:hypothetical protein
MLFVFRAATSWRLGTRHSALPVGTILPTALGLIFETRYPGVKKLGRGFLERL